MLGIQQWTPSPSSTTTQHFPLLHGTKTCRKQSWEKPSCYGVPGQTGSLLRGQVWKQEFVTSLFPPLSFHFTEGKIRSRKERRWLVQSQTVELRLESMYSGLPFPPHCLLQGSKIANWGENVGYSDRFFPDVSTPRTCSFSPSYQQRPWAHVHLSN